MQQYTPSSVAHLCIVCRERPYDADKPPRHPHQVEIRFLCPTCLAEHDRVMAAWAEYARREAAGLVPPYSEEDAWILFHGPWWFRQLEKGMDWRRHKRRPGKPLDAATEWLRRQGPDRGRAALYWDWLIEDGSKDSPNAWDRFRKLWKQYFGGK